MNDKPYLYPCKFFPMAWHKIVAKLSHLSSSCLEKVYVFVRKTFGLLQAVHTGFWLGVMGEKSLDYSDELIYNETKKYRDDKYNLSGLYDWEKQMINKNFIDAKNIMVIAAGGGREVVALSRLGYKVDGYECNIKLVEFASDFLKKEGVNASIRFLERNTVPDGVKKYDGIIIGWGAYSFIVGSKKRREFLKALYPFMNEGSSLLISFLYERNKTLSDKIIKGVSNFFRYFSDRPKTESGDRLVPDYMHYFTEDEIKNELVLCNYKIKDFLVMGDGCVVAGLN